MKRILILTNNDIGLYKFRKELIQSFLHAGHEVIIALPYGEYVENLKETGCTFVETPMERRGMNPVHDLKLYRQYCRIINKEQPDLVITYTIKPNIYGGAACRKLGVPYVSNITGLGTAFQSAKLKTLVSAMYRYALRKSKTVFFENEPNRTLFVNEGIIDEAQSYRLNGAGVNLEDYPLTPMSQSDTARFLFIGRVMKEKGIDELLEAADKLRQEANIRVDIVGPYEDDYQSVITDKMNDEVIRYHGYQKDVRPFIEDCSCFVLPSYHEGMANTLLECASMGRPLITSDIPGCREAVINNETGFLCNVKDADSLYNAMKSFIALSYDRRKAMGIAGRKHMEDVFAKEKVVNETVSRVNTVMNWKEENE